MILAKALKSRAYSPGSKAKSNMLPVKKTGRASKYIWRQTENISIPSSLVEGVGIDTLSLNGSMLTVMVGLLLDLGDGLPRRRY